MHIFKEQLDRILKKLEQQMTVQHKSIRTEDSYVPWIKQYLRHMSDDPGIPSEQKVNQFLTYLAVERNLSPSSQTVALNAIVFLYRHIFEKPLQNIGQFKKSTRKRKLPVVLSRDEVTRVRNHMKGIYWLMASLLYGSGLRANECLSLRTQDIDFDRKMIFVRAGKGGKDRTVQLPIELIQPLRQQIENARRTHKIDLADGLGGVYLPYALERKFGNSKDFRWQYIFQSTQISQCRRTGIRRRHHRDSSGLSKAIREAAAKAGIMKRVGPHTLRHSFATHLYESGVDIAKIQQLLGHRHIETTMIYTHVAQNAATSIPSPLELPENVTPIARSA